MSVAHAAGRLAARIERKRAYLRVLPKEEENPEVFPS